MSDFDQNQPLPPWGDTQPQTPAFNADDMPPTSPVPLAATVPPANDGSGRRRLVLTIAGAVVAVLIILAATLFAFAKQQSAASSQTVSQIISKARQAKITDATYSLQGQFGVNIGGTSTPANTSTSLPITGSGKFTSSPARNDISLSLSILSAQTAIEVITDGSTAYLKASGLSGLTGQPDSQQWYKASLGTDQSTGAFDVSRIYDAIQNPKLVGTETINGHKSWHLTGTLNVSGLTSGATASPGISATATAIAQQLGLSTSGTTTVDLWIAQNNYFLVKAHLNVVASINLNLDLSGLTGFGGATSTPTATSGTPTPTSLGFAVDLTMTFNTWNTGITIALPPPSQVISAPTGFPGLPSSSPTPPASS